MHISFLAGIIFILTLSHHAFAGGGTSLEMWLRRGGAQPKGNLATIDLKGLKMEI